MSSRPTVALGAVAGPLLLTAAWLGLGFVSPGYSLWGTRIAPYSPISQPISGLGLGPTGPYMNAAFILSGVLILAGVAGVFASVRQMRAFQRCAAALALALPGGGSIVDGLFTFEHFFLHFLGFALALSTVIGFPVAGWCLRKVPGWRAFGNALIVAGPVTLALALVYFATFTPTVQGVQTGIAGLTERLLIVEIQAWYVVLGWRVFRGDPSRRLAFI